MWNQIYLEYTTFLLIFTRVMAIVLFNPVTGRRNVPVIIKAGLSFLIAVIINSAVQVSVPEFAGIPQFFFAALKEVLIGFSIAVIMNMFISVVAVAGEMIDVQIGLGMSRMYDPSSNISLSFTGTLFNVMFMLTFFACDGHLTLVRMMDLSFRVLPPGFTGIGTQLGSYLPELFANIIAMGFKIALPFIAAELILELAQGILMRSVPQVNVFSIGIQLKLIMGLVVLMLLIPTLAGLMNTLTTRMFEEVENSLSLWT